MTPFYNQSYERMNKIYAILFLSLFASLSASAQLSGSGYYRIKNKATGKYATLASDEMSYQKVLEGIGGQNLILDTDCKKLSLFGKTIPMGNGTAYDITNSKCIGAYATVVEKMNCYLRKDIILSDNTQSASSIFYLNKEKENSYNLEIQGTSLKTISSGKYEGTVTINIDGFYTTINHIEGTGSKAIYNLYLPVSIKYIYTFTAGNYYFCDNAGTFGVEKDASTKEEAQWYIEPATTFNVKPLEKVKDMAGHYYTTLCVDFPFSIPSEGSTVLAAYTVTGKDAEGNAVLSQLSGVIPGGTPVILECSSADEATNILNIETTTAPANKSCADGAVVSSDGNCLQGRYFNAPAATYQYKYYLNQVSNPTTANFTTDGNKLTNDKSNYRVLNCVDGVVGFYKLKNANATMGANKAFLNIKNLPEVSAAAAKRFSIETSGETTAITGIHQDAGKNGVIYDLQGRRVEHPSRHGLYIMNGKKVVF